MARILVTDNKSRLGLPLGMTITTIWNNSQWEAASALPPPMKIDVHEHSIVPKGNIRIMIKRETLSIPGWYFMQSHTLH